MVKNEYITDYLQILFNRNIDDISKDEYLNVKNMVFSKMASDNAFYDINELLIFPNIERLLIKNSRITKQDIIILSSLHNLQEITFERCYLDEDCNLSLIIGLIKLEFSRCCLSNYVNFLSLNNLNDLTIFFPFDENAIDLSYLSESQNIYQLTLEGCIIKNIANLTKLQKLEVLNLLSTKIEDNIELLNEIPKLRELYISSKYLKAGKYNGIDVYNSVLNLIIDDQNNSKGIV